MNSLNHYTWGSVGQFLYQYVAGLSPDPSSPGFKAALIKPHPGGGLDWVDSWHESVAGRYAVSWALERDRFTMEVTIPANARGAISLPWTHDFTCTERGGRSSEVVDGQTTVGSGKWLIRARTPTNDS
jgi:alpha-L-rhamnosidase